MRTSKPLLLLIIILIFISGCREKNKAIPTAMHDSMSANIYPEDDTNNFDSILAMVKRHYPYLIQRINLNTDSFPDYFVIQDHGLSTGYFFDGKTKERIKLKNNAMLWSRPGVEIEYKIIDVNCGDNQKELLVRYGGGGTAGAYYDVQLFRYDSPSNTIKEIFHENISSFGWGEEISDEESYISVNYDNTDCVNKISVTKGKFIGKKEPFSLKIKPVKKAKTIIYRFDASKNNFEIVTR